MTGCSGFEYDAPEPSVDFIDGHSAGYKLAWDEANEQYGAELDALRARLAAAEARAERLATAGRAFVEAWEKSHQLEKTDVAYRLMTEALADNEGE